MLTILFSLLIFLGPIFIVNIIEYVDSPVIDYSFPIWVCTSLILSKLFGSVFIQLVFFNQHIIGMRLKCVLDAAIY